MAPAFPPSMTKEPPRLLPASVFSPVKWEQQSLPFPLLEESAGGSSFR